MTDFEAYVQGYVQLIPSKNWIKEMIHAGERTLDFYEHLLNKQADLTYAEGKWTLKQILEHLSDTEKIFGYRALRFARGDRHELIGFDENQFANNGLAHKIKLKPLKRDFELVRETSVSFFKNLTKEELAKVGKVSGNEISVETIGKLIVGHNLHHLRIIEERYLPLLKK